MKTLDIMFYVLFYYFIFIRFNQNYSTCFHNIFLNGIIFLHYKHLKKHLLHIYCSCCHKHENNKNKRIFQRIQTNHDKGNLFSSNSIHGTQKSNTITQNMLNVGSIETLLWKHEKSKTSSWCKIIPSIGIE